MCGREVIVKVIVSLLVNPVLYNLSLPPISSPLSFQQSVYMYVFYSVNKMSHTCSILHLQEITKTGTDLLTAYTPSEWMCIFSVCINSVFELSMGVLH